MKKPKVKFLCNWQKFHEKINFSPKSPTFPEKVSFVRQNFLWLFSRQLWFFKFSPCFRQKLQKATTNSLLLGRNHWEKCIFWWNVKHPRKAQGLLKNSGKKPVFVKKPIYQGRIKNPKILGENPRSGYTGNNYNAWSSVSNRKAATSCYVMHNTA